MIVKIVGERVVDQIHGRFYFGEREGALQLAGELVFKVVEWQMFVAALLLGEVSGHFRVIVLDPLEKV